VSEVALRIEVPGEPSFITSPAYGVGTFLVHAAVKPSGALDIVRVFASDKGVEDVARGETSRKALRAEFEALAKKLHAKPIPMAGPYVASRIAEVIDEHRARGGALSEKDEAALASLPTIAPGAAHPTSAWPAAGDVTALLEDSLRLHGEPEVSRWLPSGRAVDAVARGLAGRGEIPEGTDTDEATRALFADGVDLFYDDRERRRLALALRDAAVVFGASRRVSSAHMARVVADALEDPTDARRRPRDIPFVFGLFYKYILARREADKAG
jgi:hypothetical protein